MPGRELHTRMLSAEERSKLLKDVEELDQRHADRRDAPECVRRLKNAEASFVGTEDEQYFYYELSFEQFHVVQNLLLEGSDSEEAMRKLEEALDAAKKGDDPEWTNYMHGTMAYMKNDPELLESFIKAGELNEKTLQKLHDGLVKRGKPDYGLDYQGMED